MAYDPQKHHRRSIRMKGYDYSREGLYFITMVCQNRACLFGKIENGKMILNEAGQIVEEEWIKTQRIRQNIELGEFVVMPNHFHGILEIKYSAGGKSQFASTENKFKSPSQTIGAIIRGFKGATTKRIKELISREGSGIKDDNNKEKDRTGELQFASTIFGPIGSIIWQRNYWEHIIRNEKEYGRISNYIINNPAKWTADKLS